MIAPVIVINPTHILKTILNGFLVCSGTSLPNFKPTRSRNTFSKNYGRGFGPTIFLPVTLRKTKYINRNFIGQRTHKYLLHPQQHKVEFLPNDTQDKQNCQGKYLLENYLS